MIAGPIDYQSNLVILVSAAQFLQEDIHAIGRHIRQNQGNRFPTFRTGCRIGIGVFSNNLPGHHGSYSDRSPTGNGLANSAKTRLILKKQLEGLFDSLNELCNGFRKFF